ncbi:hypothetical protein V8G54_006407 [Vigna mungo]|uniref:Uncharacterized protein n=1 Tax=Vigna mungo TaxID=3915 RepID=A0AAQ3NZY4_VIGMU
MRVVDLLPKHLTLLFHSPCHLIPSRTDGPFLLLFVSQVWLQYYTCIHRIYIVGFTHSLRVHPTVFLASHNRQPSSFLVVCIPPILTLVAGFLVHSRSRIIP